LTALLVNRYTPSPFVILANIERENFTNEKVAIVDRVFESGVGIINPSSHTNMDNPSSDPEKGDFGAPPSKSPEKTITAQDWTGPDDRDNPQNW
jgi:hypothetical protein